jgi:uncharacterized OB-fold protein
MALEIDRRQREWRERNRLAGKCIKCGKKVLYGRKLCAIHLVKEAEYMREYRKKKKSNANPT